MRQQFINHFKSVFLVENSSGEAAQVFISPHVAEEVRPIPVEAWPEMDRKPSQEEIRRTVFDLGPLKAPGLDGVTAALIQQAWDDFGPAVQTEVTRFFQTAQMKEDIAHSNLVLVPKISGPTKATDYRPISVCNLLYKVISKILAKKMQPWMNFLISKSQTAFVPGREIS